jgi:putative acetyltransferase
VPEGEIAIDDPRAEDIRQLLEHHLEHSYAIGPPEDVHALDLEGLLDPDVSFFSFRLDGELRGIGALKRLDESHAELKSMHVVEAARGGGIGRAMVEHLIGVARTGGFSRVSLETGSMTEYAAARALYARAGFEQCEPFGDYRPSPNSTFMTLVLSNAGVDDASPAG